MRKCKLKKMLSTILAIVFIVSSAFLGVPDIAHADAASTDATLSGLSLSTGTLSPTFASGTNDYTASVSNATTSVKVTPVVNESHATVTVSGSSVTAAVSGSSITAVNSSEDISLSVGDTTIPVVVTAQDGTTTHTYNITVNRASAYPTNGSSEYMKYFTNIHTGGISDAGSSAYDLRGCVDGSNWLSTTWNDNGFATFIQVGSDLQGLSDLNNGVEKQLDALNLAITQNLSFARGGKYVKIQYVVRNTSDQAQTFSLGSGADVQIGNQDNAPITEYIDGSGFYMTGNDAQFNFIGKNASEVTDVDAFWFGGTDQYYNKSKVFAQTDVTTYDGDSAMYYSWKDRTIPAGGSQTFSVLIGVSTPNALPVLTVNTPSADFADSSAGGSVAFEGTVTDKENSTGTELYYKVDDRTPVKTYTFTGTPGAFTANLAIPSDLSVGTHTIKLYALDSAGGISAIITKTIKINAQPVFTDSTAYMKYMTNLNTEAASDSGSSAYDIRGCVDGSHWLSTTYADGGFGTFLKVGTNLEGLTSISNGVEKSIDSLNLAVTQNLSFARGGKYVKVQYVVKNTLNHEQTFSLCSGADVQIGNEDDAPVTAFADGSGFYMTGDDAQFNFIGKGAPEVTDVDAFWFGYYDQFNEHDALFTQTSESSYNGDSGMCYSWNNRTIPAGGSQTFSVLIGIGAPNALPVLAVSTPSANFADSNAGGNVSFGGTVTDSENSTGTELYYKIDDRTPVKAYTFTGTPGAFTANIALPADLSVGTHTIKLYALDSDGGISTLVTKTIIIQAPSSNNVISTLTILTPEPKVEQIVVDVKQGESDQTASQIVISRSTDGSGNKTDSVTYAADKARDTVSKLKESGESTARIVIPDNSSAVSKTTVNIPTDTLNTLSEGNVALQIDTGVAKIDLPKEAVTNAGSNANGNLYFNLVPVKQEEQKSELMERAKTQFSIVNQGEQDAVSVVGVPVTIETNMPSGAVDITLPLTGVTIPSDATEKEVFLKQLGVYIEHSDGTKELVQGEIVTYANGVQGIKFHITKFSTFTIVKIDDKQKAEVTPVVVQKGFSPLLFKAKAGATTQTLSYQKVAGADGYILYGAPCGKDKHIMIIKTMTADTTSYSVTGQAINTYYKYQVKAYQLINGKKVIIAVSKLIHSTTNSKKYTNPSKVTCSTTALTLKAGNTKTLKCNVVSTKGKTIAKHTDVLRYESTDTAIVAVDSKGKITAKAKGTCYIFAYAQNGVYKKIKVTVE